MPEKVLLIHGIAMRSEAKVTKYAASLNELIGERYELVPVYWGDLGADDTYLHKVIGRHATSSTGFSSMVHEAVSRLEDFTHPARADAAEDVVVADDEIVVALEQGAGLEGR